jgi:hypothetical protein
MGRVPADGRIRTLRFFGQVALDSQIALLEQTTNRQHHTGRALQLLEKREHGGKRDTVIATREPILGDVEQLG